MRPLTLSPRPFWAPLSLLATCLMAPSLSAAPLSQNAQAAPGYADATQLQESAQGKSAMAGFRRWDGQGRPPIVEASALAEVGDQRSFKIYNFETSAYDEVLCTLRAVGGLSYIWVEDGQFGPAKVSAASLDELLEALEESTPEGSLDPSRGILPIEQELFGSPPNIDGSGVVHIVISDIQDSYTEGCGCSYTAGFFDPVDLDPANPNSDVGDILYVDAFPGIYSEDRPANPERILGTLAHEYQHLIHASFGNLPLFQNEGQSEWATLVTGFGARSMEVLTVPEALNVPLFSWGQSGKVAYDYQRSGLVAAYLAGQVGPEAVGAITRSAVGGSAAYGEALAGSGISFDDALANFSLALWANDPALGPAFAFPQADLSRVGLPWPTLRLEGEGSTPSFTRSLEFGGAEFLQWIGVGDVTLNLSQGPGLSYRIVGRPLDGGAEVAQSSSGGEISLGGEWESLGVAAVNTRAIGDEVLAPGSRDVSISASYTSLGIHDALLRHYDPTTLSYFVALPRTEDQTKQAVRLSPYVTGDITELLLGLSQFLDGSPNPIGEGALVIHLAESVLESSAGSEAVYVPGEILGTHRVPFEDLGPGLVSIDTRGLGWTATSGEERQLILEIEGEGSLYFNLDSGSEDVDHPDYYPARTRRWQESEGTWDLTWANNGNIVVAARIIGELNSAPSAGAPRFPKAGSADIPLPLRLAWYPIQGASTYDIQLTQGADFTSPILDTTGFSGTWTAAPDIDLGTAYSWRVRGVNGAGPGEWSAPQSFETRPLSEGGEALSYINKDEIYWAVTLPFADESAWSLRFTPYMSGEITSLELDLSDFPGQDNPVGEGSLVVSLHDDLVDGDPDTPDSEHFPGAELESLTLSFSDLQPGLNTIDIPGWAVTALEDQHIVLTVTDLDEGAGVTFDLDNGDLDIVDVDYYPARTRRDVNGSGEFSGTWLNNGNIGLSVNIGAPVVTEEALSYFDPATLYWYATLPYGDETAAAYRISPNIDGVVNAVDFTLTTFFDGSVNPYGEGSLMVELWESTLAQGSDDLYIPGGLIGTQSFSFAELASGLNSLDVSSSQWTVEAGGEYHVVVKVSGTGQVYLDLDNGSEDVTDERYYPARTLRYWDSTSSWDQQWFNNGNLAIAVTIGEADGGPSGCGGGDDSKGGAGLIFLGMVGIMGARRRRRG